MITPPRDIGSLGWAQRQAVWRRATSTECANCFANEGYAQPKVIPL